MSGYIFDNAAEQPTAQRFASLEQLYDPRTRGFLAATGLAPGWRCWEVGGGSGSVAAWLADQVGPSGHVLATDIDPRFLQLMDTTGRPQVAIMRHDVGIDPLPDGPFDVIHARLVFVHVPGAPQAVARLVDALRPGGWLVIEDFDPSFIDRSFPSAGSPDAPVIATAFRALGQLLLARGAGPGWGRQLYQRFVALGLQDVGMEAHFAVRRGGSPGAKLDRANFVQIREEALAAGLIAGEDFDRMLALLDDPACAFASPTMFTAWGRRA